MKVTLKCMFCGSKTLMPGDVADLAEREARSLVERGLALFEERPMPRAVAEVPRPAPVEEAPKPKVKKADKAALDALDPDAMRE